MVSEEVVVSLSGGAPWGFRLQGGAEHQKPLQVSKVRRRSKACRAGLKEDDELVAINDQVCSELSHAQAMSLIDSYRATLNLKIKRAPSTYHSVALTGLLGRAASPRTRVLSPPLGPLPSQRCSVLSPTGGPGCLTSPPDSEAYYGETDSDADTQAHTHRRHRRTPPHARSPGRHDNQQQEEEETSEMSGYESAPDGGVTLQGHWDGPAANLCGVPRREVVYQPPQAEWTTPGDALPTPPPTPDQAAVEGEGEVDSGFQEAGGCVGLSCPPLVSPERAKEAMMLGSSRQLVPMVGPQKTPVSEELSTTYKDKARQAKLQRGESVVEKQVKEARTKCRSIASLLTDAPDPHSKGVLMFKKRRQRAKKYTLTCFGKVEGDGGTETEGETGGEEEEEGGSSFLSGSEVDEEGFTAAYDPTWDSGYLDMLDRRSSACPSGTATNHSTGLGVSAYQSPGVESSAYKSPGVELSYFQCPGIDSSTNQGNSNGKQLISTNSTSKPTPMYPTANGVSSPLTNGDPRGISLASVVLSPPSQTPPPVPNHFDPNPNPNHNMNVDPNLSTSQNSVLNRTARPFTPGLSPLRPPVTTVLFRPPQPKPKPSAVSMVTTPTAAVSMVTAAGPEFYPSPVPPASHSQPFTSPPQQGPPSSYCPPQPPVQARPPPPAPTHAQPAPPLTFNPYINMTGSVPPPTIATMATAAPPQPATADSLASREQRIAVPASRTGILQDARRRSNRKPMFSAVEVKKDVSPNPALLSLLQNMDGQPRTSPGPTGPTGPGAGVGSGAEAGHESGPEEDWLRLGAEACNFMQAQKGPKPPPVAPKPQVQTPQVPQLGGKGGQLFARRQNRMDRYVVERAPSTTPFSPTQPREPSPTPSLPATWKYSSSIRAPPPISYNPLLSPSCPPKAQKQQKAGVQTASQKARSAGKKAAMKPLDIMCHQPYQLNSSLFSYGGGTPQAPSTYQQQPGMTGGSQGPVKNPRVYEVKRFSTPPPMSTGPALKVIAPRSATTLGEPLWRSDVISPPPVPAPAPHQSYQPQPSTPASYQSALQWTSSQQSPPPPPAPTAPLPKLPFLSSAPSPQSAPLLVPSFSHLQPSAPVPANRQFKSAPDLSPLAPGASGASGSPSSSGLPARVPRPRFSTSNLGLQPHVWHPGSTMH
ncbi:synaptopodin 2-like protein [Aplochiton taeniatus]